MIAVTILSCFAWEEGIFTTYRFFVTNPFKKKFYFHSKFITMNS